MKSWMLCCLVFLGLTLGSISCFAQPVRTAEGLWNERLAFDSLITHATVTIVPFSTSNCGYCLIDGYFTEENYIRSNERNGGTSMHQCLFNAQLDMVAFQKHFRWNSPILTWPPALHQYHENGFPTLLAFRNGKQVLKEFYNYDAVDTLGPLLWDHFEPLIPTGELHLATRLIYENDKRDAIIVIPRGVQITQEMEQDARKWNAYSYRNIDRMQPADFHRHLMFKGTFNFDDLSPLFKEQVSPVQFDHQQIVVGEYGFPFDSAGIQACFPSPFDSSKMVVLHLSNGMKCSGPVNYLDFVVYTGNDSAHFSRLIYGHFNKSHGRNWIIDKDHTFSDVLLSRWCIKKCAIPVTRQAPEVLPSGYSVHSEEISTRYGRLITLGNKACRFPFLAAGGKSGPMITWEEDGNILLAHVMKDDLRIRVAEGTGSDSYNPVVATEGSRTWVCWLGNTDGYYRVYGRFSEGNQWSQPILLSAKEPVDAITLTAASDGKEITLAWSEWRANQRYLRTTTITGGIPAMIRNVPIVPSHYINDYQNAWYPSLCYTGQGTVWGAWNQHYPGSFCLASGWVNAGEPVMVTASAKNMEDWETGGYPALFCDNDRNLFVVYESNGWEVYWNRQPQRIRMASALKGLKQWTPATDLPVAATMQNQTPVAVCDAQNNTWVAWSGREEGESSFWGIWICVKRQGEWSDPVKVSPEGDHARYPKIICDQHSAKIMVSWHAGSGESMKTQLLITDFPALTGRR